MASENTLNPYAKFLAGRDALAAIAETPANYSRLLAPLDPARLADPPAPGKWSIRDILAHLADTEMVFGFRLRHTVAGDNPVIQPFDQDQFARYYSGVTAAEALQAFLAFRAWNLLFIRSVMPGAASKVVTHPERGAMTFQTILETMGGHDRNHYLQIESIARGAAA